MAENRNGEYLTRAYAKINLCLDVLGKLENGYHTVKMIMQTVGIYDELTFRRTTGEICLTSDCGELPLDEHNLIYQAIRLMQEEYQIEEGVSVSLKKNIPIAAGMAGGSTDAAATLKAMNLLFDLKLPAQRLMELGLRLGADVPYCVMGGTALAEGIGEKLTALPKAPECILLVAKPDISVSTKYVYEHLDAADGVRHPDVDGMVAAIREGNLDGVTRRLGNVLECVTIEAYPVIDRIKRRMKELGARGSLMSGSGPTVFGIFQDGEGARKACARMEKEGLARQLFVTKLV
ncbi:MAG: 4-(cytidine 5'-diphospho)-2-C-methyl-D-erythritol kinase [Roseburia sp.]|nr:4-(cytidine 5'-diphospho)-2-C-methyl-D-erythritol kinase [Roseburia sp.]